MYFVLPWISNMRGSAKTVVEMVGWVADLSDSEDMETARRIIIVVYYTIDSIRGMFDIKVLEFWIYCYTLRIDTDT